MGKKEVHMTARWFDPWPWSTWDAAYAVIVRAGSGDAKAKGELDAIKKNASQGNAQAVEAKKKFDAVAKLVTKGLPKPSEFMKSRQARPDRRSDSLKRPGAAQAMQRQQQQMAQRQIAEARRRQREQATQRQALEQERQKRIAENRRAANINRTRRQQMAQAYEGQIDELEAQLEQRRRQDELDAALAAQAERFEAERAQAEVPSASGLPEGDNESPAPIDIGPSGSAPGDVEFGE